MTSRTRNVIIALSVIGVCALFFLGVMVGAAVVGYKAATRAGNEAATIQNLKTIAAAEVQYFNDHNRTFATFDQLVTAEMLSRKFDGRPTIADGYVFELTVTPKPDGSSWYKITVDPQDKSTGANHFYLDSDDHRIHVNAERQAGPADSVN